MRIKKYLGSFALLLAAVIVNASPASYLGIGVEEMPESLKKLR